MAIERLGIIMNGVTGRMGTNQHLIRSICAIRSEGGVRLADGRRVMPDPVLVGRNADKLSALAAANGVTRWSTDLTAALANKDDALYFDSASTGLRAKLIKQAIAAGKHIYTEKPVAPTVREAMDLYRAAKAAGIKHGVVQDKLWLPGLLKMKMLVDSGFFGRILSVQGEFGYWVFEGDWQPAQRPSWNNRRHALPLALCARQSLGRSQECFLSRRDAHSEALGRARPRVQGDCRRCCIRDLRTCR